MDDRPLFEVETPSANAAARRLTTAAKVQAVLFGGTATDTVLIETMLDRVSQFAAAHCNLARDAAGTLATFGRETCKATWLATGDPRGDELLLPWRQPVTEIASIVENGVELAETDYRLLPGGILQRLCGDAAAFWCLGKIVVEFTAGFDLANAGAPPDLEAAAIEQVKAIYLAKQRDPSLRSLNVPDVFAGSFSIAGGDSVGESGLLVQVEGALAPYKGPAL